MVATGARLHQSATLPDHELLRALSATDRANGFANRSCSGLVRQSKFIPSGKGTPTEILQPFFLRFSRTLERARTRGELTRDEETGTALGFGLSEVGGSRTRPYRGHSRTGQRHRVLRLSLLYALLDEAEAQRTEHRDPCAPPPARRLAVWDYCKASAYHIFGNAVGRSDCGSVAEAH